MYSIVEISGHQYHVEPGIIIDVEKLDMEVGSMVDFEKVLFVGGKGSIVGTPMVKGAKVQAKVIRQARSRKILVFKRSPGQWQKKNGHRQPYTSLLITGIQNGQGEAVEIEADSKKAKKYLKAD